MGLFLRQADDRSKLQTRLAEELREKVRAAQVVPGDQPEVEPDLLADGRQTRPAGMIIMVLAAVILLATVIWLVNNF